MPEAPSDTLQDDPYAVDYGPRFFWWVILLAAITVVLHVAQFFFVRQDLSSIGRAALPHNAGFLNPNRGHHVQPGCGVVWNNEIWIAAISGPTNIYYPNSTRPPSSRLVVINAETGSPRETSLSVSPAPIGLVVLEGQLWIVTESTVYRVENEQLMQRNPRRALNDPSRPFVYQGKLAVIDKNVNDIWTLLTYHEGEWEAVGLIDVTTTPGTPAWFKPSLHVISDGDNFVLFYWHGLSLHYREGFGKISDPESVPLSALVPENDLAERKLSKLPNTMTGGTSGQTVNQIVMAPGWKPAGIPINWNQSWDAVYIDGIPTLFSTAPGSSTIQTYEFRNGTWTSTGPQIPINTSGLSAVAGSKGFLVCDGLQLIAASSSSNSKLTAEAVQIADRLDFVISMLSLCARYSILAVLLTIGTWWLMSRYRSSNYLYGTRSATKASIIRRSIARGIDTVVTVFPPLFWFAYLMQFEERRSWPGNPSFDSTMFLFAMFSICGTWLGGVLVLSIMQGLWGVTPGKWLCGIRTFRTTLRPCGVLRGVTREMLLYIDGLFLAVWLPGVLSIAFTKNWQRMGDLAADTIVIIDPQRPSWLR